MNGRYDDGRPARNAGPGPEMQGPGTHGHEIQGFAQPGALPGPLLRELQPPYRRTGGHVAVVHMYGNGGYRVQRPDRPRDEHAKPLLRQAVSVFEVVLGWRVTRFRLSLPAAGDAESFRAEAAVRWEVEDPVLTVRRQVWNVADLMHDPLVQHLRYVSRRFPLTQAQAAEETLQSELDSGRFTLGEELGLSTKIHVRIDLSERVGERISAGSHLDLDLALSDKEHALDRRKEQHESALVRERAKEFESLLARGDEGRIAYFMARDPGKALQIEQHFADQRRQDESDRVAFLNRLIDAGLIERHDIREGVYEALQFLQKSGRQIGRTVSTALPRPPRNGDEPDQGPESGRASGRRRPFWEDGSDGTPELEASSDEDAPHAPDARDAAQDATRDPARDAARDPDPYDPWEASADPYPSSGPYEPSSVESAGERAERTRGEGDFTSPGRGVRRASDRFDDWEE